MARFVDFDGQVVLIRLQNLSQRQIHATMLKRWKIRVFSFFFVKTHYNVPSASGWKPSGVTPSQPHGPRRLSVVASPILSRLVDGERSPTRLPTIQPQDGLICLVVIRHGNEGKAARLSSVWIGNDLRALNAAIRLE